MFTYKSPTQAYIYIYTTFGRSLDDLNMLKYIGYDRACDLHPFLKDLKAQGSQGVSILLEQVQFIVDILHCNN